MPYLPPTSLMSYPPLASPIPAPTPFLTPLTRQQQMTQLLTEQIKPNVYIQELISSHQVSLYLDLSPLLLIYQPLWVLYCLSVFAGTKTCKRWKTSDLIDFYAKFVFPATFAIFNLVFWVAYLLWPLLIFSYIILVNELWPHRPSHSMSRNPIIPSEQFGPPAVFNTNLFTLSLAHFYSTTNAHTALVSPLL